MPVARAHQALALLAAGVALLALLPRQGAAALHLLKRGYAPLPPTCKSNVYCNSQLLHHVQMANLYTDSKTFVDLKLKCSEEEILNKYEEVLKQYNDTMPPKEVLKSFVKEYFEEGNELEEWIPSDYTDNPSLVHRVQDPLFKKWVLDLNYIFLSLSRKVKPDVKLNPDLYSLLYVPHGFVIPGGRFRELYYWDTYWIISGLLLCDMVTTARGVIENFIYLIRTYNIIPNGSRKYYLQRTQPPLLIPMVEQYYKHTKDLEFVRQNIEVLEIEFKFWMKNRMVRLKKNNVCHKLARYYCPSSGPRPESYREDYMTAENEKTEAERNALYINIKSAAESGHDFSSRWFIKDGTNAGNLSNIDTANIIPVDLNAFLQMNARLLSEFYSLLGNEAKAKYFKKKQDDMLAAMEAILWNGSIWLDYDLRNHKPRDFFYMTNLVPLWTMSYNPAKRHEISKSVLYYINENKLEDYIGGIPTSLTVSGEQWDFPNAWPPLQSMWVFGLHQLHTPAAYDLALRLAEKWLRSNYKGFKIFHKMFEKYDVTLMGQTGTGGEYKAQTGFGWSNGLDLMMLAKYGDKIFLNDDHTPAGPDPGSYPAS